MASRFSFKKTRLLFVSPWLLAAAIGLLALIILIFAANNIRRERGMLTESLFRKGQALVSFVEAGMRASMMSGMMGNMMSGMMGLSDSGLMSGQTQRLIEQAAEDPEIHYIAVLDMNGRILVHSDPEQVGGWFQRDLSDLKAPAAGAEYHIVSLPEDRRRVFEVVSPFQPFRHHRRGTGEWRRRFLQEHPVRPGEDDPGQEFHSQLILVGLDMTELETAMRQYRVQMVFLSLTLLLVGLGGWISLLAAQGYRVSQETLNRIQAFTGLLISRLPVGIAATDPEGKIRTFNQAASRLTGLEIEKVTGSRPSEVLPPVFASFFQQLSKNEELSDRDIHYTTGEGDNLVLHLSSMPVHNREGEYMGRVLLMYDLSEIKKLEKEVQRHDRLVALGKMAAGVAHEVRNPLSSIKGFATLLGNKFSETSKEYETASLLVHEAERLNRSITELLNYARPTPLKREPVDLAEIVRNSLKLISTDAEALNIRQVFRVPETQLPEVWVDPDRLNQVLLNLYLNALQAMGEDGTLSVAVEQAPSGEAVEILVEDTGPGIPEEISERILDPYFTTKPEGTGLGLALAYKIIDEHGGTIRFDSPPGRGTIVTVRLPAGGGTNVNRPVRPEDTEEKES